MKKSENGLYGLCQYALLPMDFKNFS